MRKLVAIIAAVGLIGCATAPAIAAQKGGGKTPQATTQQTVPVTGGRKATTRKLTPDKIEAGSENVRR